MPEKEENSRNFRAKREFLIARTMTTPHNPEPPQSPEEFELSQDQELWDLLGQSKPGEANPLLSRNVLREIRLQENSSTAASSFWSKLLRPRVLVPGALAALALTVALAWNPSKEAASGLAEATDSGALPVAVATSFEDSLESELLLAAADTPSLFSDEEVVAMLF